MLHNPLPYLIRLAISSFLLLAIFFYGLSIFNDEVSINLLDRHSAPSTLYWFGTDNLGRDIWERCFQGAVTSLHIGVGAALCSSLIAITLATLSRVHPIVDSLIRICTDAMLSLPHLLLLILICFTFGGGKHGVLLAIALTHWPRLALVLRAEAEKVSYSDYLLVSHKIGRGNLYCWQHHYVPVLLPQWMTGTLLIFPHAILHSAALSFLGFGLAAHEPSLGILLADALRFISRGNWWMVVFPGFTLFSLVMLFDQFAQAAKHLWLGNKSC